MAKKKFEQSEVAYDISGNTNPAAETGVISSLFKFGFPAFVEASTFVNRETFSVDSNAVAWQCVEHIYKNDTNATITIPLIISAAQSIGLGSFYDKPENNQHLRASVNFPIEQSNITPLAAKIKRLQVARLMRRQLIEAESRIGTEITGDEALAHILGIAQNAVFDFSSLVSDDSAPQLAFGDIDEYVEFLINNPCNQVGVPTGFALYDEAIGGGLRFGGVAAIAARLKTGKSALAINMGYNISGNGIPVLYLDTEMKRHEHADRMLAKVTGIPIRDIETGRFSQNPDRIKTTREAALHLKGLPFTYKSICGWDFADIISTARRWVIQDVGLKNDGKANPCVVILDYLKIMASSTLSKNIAEHQELGFAMTSFVNFANQYNVAGLTFLQSNRDGINRNETDVVASSDRISWFASNLSLLTRQSREEIDAQSNPRNAFNRKLVPLVARHGPDFTEGDWINMRFEGHLCRMTEGPLQSQLETETRIVGSDGQIEVEDDEDTVF